MQAGLRKLDRQPCLRSSRSHSSRPCKKVMMRPAFAAAPTTGIITRLLGQPLLKLNQNHSVVPLLSAEDHQLPFAAALHIHHPELAESAGSQPLAVSSATLLSRNSKNSNNPQPDAELVELIYVLSGSGYFSSSTGILQQIAAGDSVIAVQNEVTVAAGMPPHDTNHTQVAAPSPVHSAASNTTSSSGSGHTATRHWRKLVPWFNLHQHHHHSQSQQPQEQQQQLVLLQLLLPSELLTGELEHYNAGHCKAVAQHLPWSGHTSSGLQSDTCIDQRAVCQLLSGAQQPPQPRQQQQQVHDDQAQQQQQLPATPQGSSNRSSDKLPPIGSQQVQKRCLSEVSTFQLPAQTNRLALLFGPHASPAVCLSFGVEVFEPGHITPLHTHSSAHELFFVLAGKGVGVHGPGGQERVELSAGDVAVFPPGVLHGVDNMSEQQLYCLQMMLPNESFVEWVRSGQAADTLDVGAVQRLAAAASCG